jgi:hypothetical protein
MALYNAIAGIFDWDAITYRDVFEMKIQNRNQETFNFSTGIRSDNNIVYVRAVYFQQPPDTEGEVVGIDNLGPNAPIPQYTNVNTVVVSSDCQSVITSHPGMPSRLNLSITDPRIRGNTRHPNGSPTWWSLTQFKYIW